MTVTRRARWALRIQTLGLMLLVFGIWSGIPSTAAEPVVDLTVKGHVLTAPATLMMTVRVAPDARNRGLAITADSADFARSSTIELDGADEPPVHQMLFKDLPEGDYVVSAKLIGVDGVRGYSNVDLRVRGSKGGR